MIFLSEISIACMVDWLELNCACYFVHIGNINTRSIKSVNGDNDRARIWCAGKQPE